MLLQCSLPITPSQNSVIKTLSVASVCPSKVSSQLGVAVILSTHHPKPKFCHQNSNHCSVSTESPPIPSFPSCCTKRLLVTEKVLHCSNAHNAVMYLRKKLQEVPKIAKKIANMILSLPLTTNCSCFLWTHLLLACCLLYRCTNLFLATPTSLLAPLFDWKPNCHFEQAAWGGPEV